MPLKLYQALEESLCEDNLMGAIAWTAAALDQSCNPLAIHGTLTEYENSVMAGDP